MDGCEQQTYKHVHILMPLFFTLGKNINFMDGEHELGWMNEWEQGYIRYGMDRSRLWGLGNRHSSAH
jgi:hypothetical protein